MSHIFRLHKEGNNTLVDWDIASKYGSAVIDQIEDPNGESSSREITSIPSPFARIDLVKTAFAKVVEIAKKTRTLEGDTIHHKMVSDCFDVGQLFFEFDKHKDKLDIIVWDKENDMKALLESDNPSHRQLGETYRVFLEQDGEVYNFDRMERMYLLNFTKDESDTAEINIIGATSPATLFFTSSNNLDYVTRNIQFGNDCPFDKQLCPLNKRDLGYLKYLWALKANIENFSKLFKEVEAYMTESFNLMDERIKKILKGITKDDLGQFTDIPVGGSSSHPVEVLQGIKLKQYIEDPGNIEKDSGFVIDSEHRINEHKPLALPVDIYTHPTIYTKKDKWNKNTKVSYCICDDDNHPIPPEDRTLPNEGSHYPFLTISDFLTDTIVRMPYEINKESFFDGNIDRADGKSYLLPLTNLFFLFFTTEQLQGNMKDGKKMFELKNNAGGITVVLRIPIKDNKYIEYRRTYFEAIEPDIEKNDGGLVEKTFGLGIMPLIKFPENVRKHYRVALFDLDTQSTGIRDLQLTFLLKENIIPEQSHCVRDKKDIDIPKSSIEAYSIIYNFDRINIYVDNIRCVLIPKFKMQKANSRKQFTFAVDFGTTNTHIEYAVDNGNPETFNILENEKQLHKLYGTFFSIQNEIEEAIKHNFIPDKIADNTQFTFPMRTAFSEYSGINYDTLPSALVDGNVPFLYEKWIFPDYNELKTDLKWNGVPDKLVRLYLENLFLLMFNKVLLNGGNLEITKIIWFYPASMDEGRVIKFNKIWNDLYKAYFGNEPGEYIISISESAAPFQYYKKKQGAKSEVVTIDIGGGTTDVYVVENTLPKMLLSFRYASEALFGDAFNWDSDNNGFVNLYEEKFTDILKANDLGSLGDVMHQIERKKKSPDIIAFFFSLATNKEVKGNDALNFMEQLAANDRLRYAFIVFYGAILYFIAKTMYSKGLKKPLTLAFSGNGSKTLSALSSSNDMIARFAKLIFDGVYGESTGKISVIVEENPKKATCKGGILVPEKQEYDSIAAIKHTFVGDKFDSYPPKKIKYSEITDKIKADVVQQVSDFVIFLFKLHEDNNDFFINKLTADPSVLNLVKDICMDKVELEQSLNNGLDWKLKSLDDNGAAISETLFFYPLVGVLHEIAREISEL